MKEYCNRFKGEAFYRELTLEAKNLIARRETFPSGIEKAE